MPFIPNFARIMNIGIKGSFVQKITKRKEPVADRRNREGKLHLGPRHEYTTPLTMSERNSAI